MSTFKLSSKSERHIEIFTGMNSAAISNMDAEDIDKNIEKRIGKKLTSDINDDRLIGRGSIYLFLHRFIRTKWIDKILSRI